MCYVILHQSHEYNKYKFISFALEIFERVVSSSTVSSEKGQLLQQ